MQNRAIVLIGQRRNVSWPKEVPSIPHPVIARKITKNNKQYISFDRGITGSETFEINDQFKKNLQSQKTEYFCLNAGSKEWPSIYIKTKDLQKAVEFIESEKSINWIAHVGIPNKQGSFDYKIMVDSDYVFNEKADPEHVKEHFEIELGLNPDQDIDKNQNTPQVYDVMITPRGMENMPNIEKATQKMQEQEKKSKQIWDELIEAEAKEVRDIEKKHGLQVWEGKIDRIFKRSDLFVNGVLVTEAGNKVNFVASGDPQKSIDQTKPNDIVKVMGRSMQDNQNEFNINLVSSKIIQRGSVKKDLER